MMHKLSVINCVAARKLKFSCRRVRNWTVMVLGFVGMSTESTFDQHDGIKSGASENCVQIIGYGISSLQFNRHVQLIKDMTRAVLV